MNKVFLVGRLTKEPEDRTIYKDEKGFAIASVTLAVDGRKMSDGSHETSFIPLVCFANVAENMINLGRKGALTSIDGTLRQRSYENKDGKTVSVIEVIVDNFTLLEKKPEEKTTTKKSK